MREKHQVFETWVDACLGRGVYICASMSQKMEKLNQSPNGQCLKFLGFQQSLPKMYVFNDLQSYDLCDMHRVGPLGSAGLGQVPPVLAQYGCILIALQRLRFYSKRDWLTSSIWDRFCSRNDTSMRFIVTLGFSERPCDVNVFAFWTALLILDCIRDWLKVCVIPWDSMNS